MNFENIDWADSNINKQNNGELMRKITLEKVIDRNGVHLIATKKVSPFDAGDIIKLITPDGTHHVILDISGTNSVCDGCLFEYTRRKYGISTCPTFKDDSLLCVHAQDKDSRFIPIDSVLENL